LKNRIARSALVNYTAQQMFDLVNDVESYPQFMDGCVGAQVLARGEDWLEARLELQKAGIGQSFVTRNRLEPPTLMTMSLVEGPFSRLEGKWQFTSLGDHSCKVEFELEFTLQSRLLGMAVGKLFEVVASRQVDALCNRARVIYGVPPKTH
jgi:ribosome-associated toxin RatA of RatAB toxin-antitoxin module